MNTRPDDKTYRRLLVQCVVAVIAVNLARVFLNLFRDYYGFDELYRDILYHTVVVAILAFLAIRLSRVWTRAIRWGFLAIVVFAVLDSAFDIGLSVPAIARIPAIGLHVGMYSIARNLFGIFIFLGFAVVVYQLDVERAAVERRRVQILLSELARGTSNLVGADFLSGLVESIGRTLDVKYVFLSENSATTGSRTIAAFGPAMDIADVHADLEEGPCAITVSGHEPVCYGSGLSEHFPESRALASMRAESYYGLPLLDASQQILGHICVIDDKPIALSPGMISSLQIFASRAAAEVERTRADEERAKIEAKMVQAQRLESLGVLTGGIAHDFNNLLTGIRNHATLARNSVSPASAASSDLDQIERITDRAAGLCQQLLVCAGHSKGVECVCLLDGVVRDTVDLVRTAVSHDVCIVEQLSPEPIAIKGDPSQLSQIVLNLLTNAAEAVDENRGRIVVRTSIESGQHANVKDCLPPPADDREYALLEVTDDGCGMDESTVRRMFDPFFTTKGHGYGLGMAAVVGAVRNHRGGIAVKSTLGEGTVVSVAIPTTEEKPKATEGDSAPAAGFPADTTVMVVDDDEFVRESTQCVLECVGITVLTASSGPECVEMCRRRRHPVSAILLDLTMPDWGGAETFRQLRKAGVTAPVIVMSGYSDEPLAEIADEVAFIEKPFSLERVVSALRASVGSE